MTAASKNMLKIAATVLVTIFLGAIGSGVWERVGSPLFDWITRGTIQFVDALVGTYKDSIYQEAGYGYREHAANTIYNALLMALPGLYLLLLLRHPLLRNKIKSTQGPSRLRRLADSRAGLSVFTILTILVTSFSFVAVTRLAYTNGITTFVYSTLDRLAPHIAETEKVKLLAEFRSVRSADDYYMYYEKLVGLLDENDLENYGVPPI